MGLTNSRGKRPARLHSSIIGIRLSSINLREVSRTSRSSSLSSASNWMKSTPRNFRDMKVCSPAVAAVQGNRPALVFYFYLLLWLCRLRLDRHQLDFKYQRGIGANVAPGRAALAVGEVGRNNQL